MPQADTTLIHLDQFRADTRFSGIDGRNQTVVVIDTGIDLNHSFFGPDANSNGIDDRIVFSYDFSRANDSNASDTNGHGSNVASIIGSQDPTYTGMAPGCNIIALKVFPDGSNPSATVADIREALDWVVANRAAYNIVAVNMSLGQGDNVNSYTTSQFNSEFANLFFNNVAVTVASGNSYAAYQSQGVSQPSADPYVWSVGAVWDRSDGGWSWLGGATDFSTGPDRIISFSQRSATLTRIFAPGGDITGANWNGGTIAESGTSQAAPHIAGLVADMQQLAVQVSGHLMSVSDLGSTMLASSATIIDGDDENDNVANTGAVYHRVDAFAWGVAILNLLFAGTAGADTLTGTPAADVIHGQGGNDILSGRDGNDTVFGDDGNDTLIYTSSSYTIGVSLSGGLDTFNGGTGTDTADFSSISVTDGAQHGLLITPSGANFDARMTTTGAPIHIATLVSIENIVGTPFIDTLLGTAGANILRGGANNDAIDGGAGVDRAAFSGSQSSYSVTPLTSSSVRVSGPDGTDVVTNVELLAFDNVTVRTGQGDSFQTPPSDFSSDFRSDILWQSSGGTPAVWLMNGNDYVLGTAVGSFNPGPSWQVRGAGDFDGNGRSDILWQNTGGSAAIWLMNGTSLVSASAAGSFNPGPSWQICDTADFNNDGKADILWQDSGGTPAIWLMNGANLISTGAVGPFNPGPSWRVIGAGDFDGNGKSDILWQGSDGTPAIWLMDGINFVSTSAAGSFNPGPSWQIRGVGDFNGDNKSDILWQSSDGTPAIWLMNGTNAVSIGAVGPFNPGPSWQVRGAEDFNGDGRADILWQGSDGTPAVWLMDWLNFLSASAVGPFNPGMDWHVIV